MNLNSKKTSLIILVITALVSSRIMFALFNDPEGPNLLVVVVMAAIVYALSFVVYSRSSSMEGTKRLLLTILSQIIIVSVFYFGLS